MNLGESIDRLYELREQKRDLNAAIADIDAQFEEIEANVLAKLQEIGVDSSKSKLASATISETVVPNVEDWDAFGRYIIDTNQLFLLQRRTSIAAYRDLLQAGETIPGVSPFTKTSLSLRKLS